jgi:hypothetical protein
VTTPKKVLDAIFSAGPQLPAAELPRLFRMDTAAALRPVPAMSGLHYLCMQQLGLALVSGDGRKPTEFEFAAAYLLLAMPAADVFALVSSPDAERVLACQATGLLQVIHYSRLPELIKVVDQAFSSAEALVPEDHLVQEAGEGSPLPKS